MDALKTLTLALTVALMGVACGDDGDDNPGPGNNMDGGLNTPDSGLDGSVAPKPTGYTLADGGALPCNAATPAANGKCGGSSCELTEAQLAASAKPGAKCGQPNEIAAFCSLSAVAAVTMCSYDAINSVSMLDKFEAETKTCSTASIKMTDPSFSDGCIDCFVANSRCTAEKCLTQCATGTGSPACETCRISSGCADAFYACAGYESPLTDVIPKY